MKYLKVAKTLKKGLFWTIFWKILQSVQFSTLNMFKTHMKAKNTGPPGGVLVKIAYYTIK